MKNVKFIALTILVSGIFFGCKNNLENENSIGEFQKQLYSMLPETYSSIGDEHNNLLKEFYFADNSRAIANYKNLSIEDYFDEIESSYYFNAFSAETLARSANSEENMSDEMVELGLISENDAEYIEKVELILENLPDSLEETKERISAIEIDSLNTKSADELVEFISYAETAKASLEFWSDNIEILEGLESNNSGRWIFKSLWKKYNHKLKMMAASDAAGAAAGAAIGATLGAQIAGVGAGPGAAVGAAIAGAASSAEGFKQDKVCIVVPLSKIKKSF